MIRLLAGDCRDVLATLPAESVQCVVTSPPYYGLRDYGTALWDGGDAACDHKQSNYDRGERANRGNVMERTTPYRDTCGKCGAVRVDRQIGLEATPDEYLATMVAVFRQIRRVMRNDAVAFINMGDSYADKQLQMIPARLAVALQADGWVLRSDIIWHKPNPMPESCRDRPTSAHEHVFMLTKSARYYYDAEAVREDETSRPQNWTARVFGKAGGDHRNENPERFQPMSKDAVGASGRNLRNVWTLSTESFSGAHFATFPSALAERCIRAGTSERGCCTACGKPWGRVVERGDLVPTRKNHDLRAYGVVVDEPDAGDQGRNRARDGHRANMAYETTTTGWSPGCQCEAATVPCTVLDPFIGAGTTALVADRLQRDVIGIDLNTQYTRMAMDRCIADAPLFTSFAPAEDPEETRMADLFTDMAAD